MTYKTEESTEHSLGWKNMNTTNYWLTLPC